MCTGRIHKRAFTLVEILIVVIILGILAAMIIPQFANASSDARETNLKTTLNNVRNSIEMFKAQHSERAPGLAGMWTLMTGLSDTTEWNVAAATGTHLGPYLQSPPINPMNQRTGVNSSATDPDAGWYYEPSGIGFTFFARNPDGTINTAY
jgi:general secretion pathway protein G